MIYDLRAWFRGKAESRKLKAEMFNLEAFRQELRGVPPDGVLWVQLMALLDAYALTEARALSSPGLDDAEAHRLRGRVGMCFDLKQDLERLMADARAKEE
jgi:hypothetical protein